MAELPTTTIADVDIMRVGSGFRGIGCPPEGCEFTFGDLDTIIETYWATKDSLRPPLKLGHDENQALAQEDGFPAIGWVSNLRRRGDRLYADLMGVPSKLADLIRAGAYRFVSAELDSDYKVDAQSYPRALVGVALLGEDLPAIDSLGGLTALYAREQLPDSGQAVLFEQQPTSSNPTPGVEPEPTTKEVEMDISEVRQALGLDAEGDPLAAIQALKGEIVTLKATMASDAPDKGEAALLRSELQTAQKAILESEAAHNRDTLNLRERLASKEAEVRVELAISQGRVTPANREYALKVARSENEEGWSKFVRTLPSVNLAELGSANDGVDIEPTAEEAAIARQMHVDPKELIAQKVRDAS